MANQPPLVILEDDDSLVLDDEPVFSPEILKAVSNFAEILNSCARDTRIYNDENTPLRNDKDVVKYFCYFMKTCVPVHGQTINYELVRLLSQAALFILFGSYGIIQKFIEEMEPSDQTSFIDESLYVRLLLCLDMFNQEFRSFADDLVSDVAKVTLESHPKTYYNLMDEFYDRISVFCDGYCTTAYELFDGEGGWSVFVKYPEYDETFDKVISSSANFFTAQK